MHYMHRKDEVRTDILALDDAVLDRASKTLAGLLLVAVIERSIEETVALLDRVVDGLVPICRELLFCGRFRCRRTYVCAGGLVDLVV